MTAAVLDVVHVLEQVEQEKTSALYSLQESQTQLRHAQSALAEQHERARRLQERVHTLRQQGGDSGDIEEGEQDMKSPPWVQDSLEGLGAELLQCKYRLAVTEVVSLKAELKELKEKHKGCVEGASRAEECAQSQLRVLEAQATRLERSCREARERAAALERELQVANSSASESHSALSSAQEDLATFSEELAQLYHHVCLCNNETPNRVMLDYYQQGRAPVRSTPMGLKAQDDHRVLLTPRLARRLAAINAATSTSSDSQSPSESPSKEPLTAEDSPARTPLGSPAISASSSSSSSSPAPESSSASDPRREPTNVQHLSAIIRDQIRHLQKAVDRSLQLSRQRAAVQELAPLIDKDKEACMEEVLKLKSLLSTKREQIATLRLVLKANKQVRALHPKTLETFSSPYFLCGSCCPPLRCCMWRAFPVLLRGFMINSVLCGSTAQQGLMGGAEGKRSGLHGVMISSINTHSVPLLEELGGK